MARSRLLNGDRSGALFALKEARRVEGRAREAQRRRLEMEQRLCAMGEQVIESGEGTGGVRQAGPTTLSRTTAVTVETGAPVPSVANADPMDSMDSADDGALTDELARMERTLEMGEAEAEHPRAVIEAATSLPASTIDPLSNSSTHSPEE
jgi:hypothetical protein